MSSRDEGDRGRIEIRSLGRLSSFLSTVTSTQRGTHPNLFTHATMNPWPPSSSSSPFHPSSAAPSSPGYQPYHPPPPLPPPPPVASSSSSSHHHHHHPCVPPPKVLNADDISDIKAVFPDLRIAAPNVCRWINPPLRGIDDSAEIASTLEMRQQHPGQPCGRILACGTILKDVSCTKIFSGLLERSGEGEGARSVELDESSFPSPELVFFPSFFETYRT